MVAGLIISERRVNHPTKYLTNGQSASAEVAWRIKKEWSQDLSEARKVFEINAMKTIRQCVGATVEAVPAGSTVVVQNLSQI